ncbi:alpha/beta hydrolase family protein [Paenibacillus glycanilyticus]|uniref:alpha/beta hydrolase family protein n=1 Tax=Paenibacillus glycanilyticus TaxID=126569 RepID=UPI001910A18F|nr:alpha/beta fold hydrolase [Paenibacillus glycanilyticus]
MSGTNHKVVRLAGVDCLQVDPIGQSGGTVLLYHGWGSTQESYLFFASIVSGWGYTVIVPELLHHGYRGTLNYADPAVLEQTFLEIVLQGSKEAVEMTEQLGGPSGGKIGIIGHSAGGFVAAGAFAKNTDVAAAVVINGSCAWTEFYESYLKYAGKPALGEEERAALAKHDPISLLTFEDERGLLLLHGKEDTTVPIHSQRYFMDKKACAAPERLRMVEYGGVNHQITLKMLEQAKLWLDSHLRAN